MSEKNLTPDLEEPALEQPAEENDTPPTTRPPISKAGFEEAEPASEGPVAEEKGEPVRSDEDRSARNGRRNGQPPADAASADREALLSVDSYDEAEALLSARPELIESGRIVFGAVVPTVNQNDFADLAIKAAAEDDSLTLKEALRQKRRRGLTLSEPEVDQLLEFADDNLTAEPLLALTVALLLTDDLTRLENALLWGKQKKIVLTTEKQLNINAMALWDSLSEPDEESTPEPEVEPAVAEVAEPEVERVVPTPPPPPRHAQQTKSRQGPPRWLLASGFIFLLTMMSCGICAVSSWF